MNFYKILIYIIASTVIFGCNDSDIIGLELPNAASFNINNDSTINFNIQTTSEDSLRSDEAAYLLLGQILDPVFGDNKASFCNQILLPYNNITQIDGWVVDSVVLKYNITDFYGDLNENNDLQISVYELKENILKENQYYSNFSPEFESANIINDFSISEGDSTNSSLLKIYLNNDFGEKIMNETGNSTMIDNTSFTDFFNGFYIEAISNNTILYLNPLNDNSRLSIYYHINGGEDSLSLEFEVGGDAARINLFNEKNISPNISGESYIQSMAGFKNKIEFLNLEDLKDKFKGKAINQATIRFVPIIDENYDSHKKLYLVREKNDSSIVFLTDYTIEGESHFGGTLNVDDYYSFNITRYFVQLINNEEYTEILYLLPSGGAVNANRTILDNSKININVIYTEN